MFKILSDPAKSKEILRIEIELPEARVKKEFKRQARIGCRNWMQGWESVRWLVIDSGGGCAPTPPYGGGLRPPHPPLWWGLRPHTPLKSACGPP